jgi:hypothetical protein
MRQLFSKADLRSLSSVLALVILLGSSPLTAGVVLRTGPSHPEITANICQPLQSVIAVSGTVLARPANAKPESVLRNLGLATAYVAMHLIEYRATPDTPPPEPLVQ